MVPLAVEVHLLAGPEPADQRHGLAQALEALPGARPLDAGRRDLVHCLARAQAEEDPARGEAAQRRERLRDDGRVVAERGRQDARAHEHARGRRGQRAEPRQRGGGVPADMPERLEMIRDADAVEAEALGRDAEREQLRGRELLGGRLVAEPQRRDFGGRRHNLGPMVARSY